MCNIKARGECPYMGQWNESTGIHGTNILLLFSWKMLTLTKHYTVAFSTKNPKVLQNTGDILFHTGFPTQQQ